MLMIRPEGAATPLRRKKLQCRESVVEGQQPPTSQSRSRLAPPVRRLRRQLKNEAVWQNFQKRRRKVEPSSLQVHAPIPPFIGHPSPNEFVVSQSHAPLKPSLSTGIPRKTMHWKGVEKFVGEDDSRDTSFR